MLLCNSEFQQEKMLNFCGKVAGSKVEAFWRPNGNQCHFGGCCL
jgi:hypothetical protein